MTFRESKRRLGTGTAIALTATLLLTACERATEVGPEPPSRSLPIAAAVVEPRNLSRELSTSAVVVPRTTIRLASRTSGTISGVHFEEGETVARGDLLAELDLSEQEAELARAITEELQTRRNHERLADLRASRTVSASEYEQAEMALRVAVSNRRLWETRVGFGRLLAPIDAVVTARHIEPGEGVAANEVVLELASMDDLVLRLAVSEFDVVHIRRGQEVKVTVDALPDLVLTGSVRRIFPAAEGESRLIPVEITLPSDAAVRGVRAGFLARVRMAIDERAAVLAVPAAAVGESDGHYVYVIEDEQLRRRPVEAGVTRGQWREIASGLAAGEAVLATNPIDMRDGQRVRVVRWRE